MIQFYNASLGVAQTHFWSKVFDKVLRKYSDR